VPHWSDSSDCACAGPPFARDECMQRLKAYLDNHHHHHHHHQLATSHHHQEEEEDKEDGWEQAAAPVLGIGGYERGTKLKAKGGEVAMRRLCLPARTGVAGCDAHEEAAAARAHKRAQGGTVAGWGGGGGRRELKMAQDGRQLKMAGWMFKRPMLLPGTRRRWVEVRGKTLRYYLEPHDPKPRGAFDLW
jgi:hypothetical protein